MRNVERLVARLALVDSHGHEKVNPLKDAHAALDAAVLDAYGFSAKKDLLAQLLDLNLQVAQRIESGEVVTSPGVPSGYPSLSRL